MQTPVYPLLFEPVYKDYIWGGTRIPVHFNRAPVEGVCAESWEVADRPEGMSIVANGPLRGKTLHALVTSMGTELVGRDTGGTFPLLIKIIDAEQRLSVQVHPDNEAAAACGGEPKTEMWYVLDARPGATLFAGLRDGVDRAAFEAAIQRQDLEPMLNPWEVRAGDAVFIPGGRVHAIGEGVLCLEVQQNSNTTYRVYDWGRVGADGRPRELHVDRALRVIRWQDDQPLLVRTPPALGRDTAHPVVQCPYFKVERLDMSRPLALDHDGSSFQVLFPVAGALAVKGGNEPVRVEMGTSCLVPAALRECTIEPDGVASVIRITLG
jgi:mannose-6-phosphate isomerase